MKLLDIVNAPWAIMPSKLHEITEIYATHLRGEKIDISGVERKIGAPLNNERQEFQVINGVAVIQMHGVIAKRMNLLSQISGGVSSQIAANEFKAALADPEVDSILLDIDSPGGTIDGTAELAQLIFESRGEKPIIAFTDGSMASAAYWIGSAAHKVFISGPTAIVGSIGVIAKHTDISKAEETAGIKTTEIYAGKHKGDGSQHQPLSKDGQQTIQNFVDDLYSAFVADVAKHRGVSDNQVEKKMADAKIFIGKKAIKAGLVDGVSTFDSLLKDMADGDSARTSTTLSAGDADVEPKPKGKDNDMDLAKLKADYPGVYVEALAMGADQATTLLEAPHAKAVKAAKSEGAKAERERIQAIEAKAAAMPGHEKLIAAIKFDGETTGDQAASQIIAAEEKKRGDMAAAIAAGAVDPLDDDASDDSGEDKKDFNALVTDHVNAEKCTRGQAISAIAKSHPTEHAAYIADANKEGGKS